MVGAEAGPLVCHQRTAGRPVPVAGVLLTAAGMAAFALIGQLETVALVFNLFIFAVFLLINLAVIGLRWR